MSFPRFQPGLGRVLRPAAHAGFPPSPALWDAANPGYFASATLSRIQFCADYSIAPLDCQGGIAIKCLLTCKSTIITIHNPRKIDHSQDLTFITP